MLKLETRSDIIHFEATNPESFVTSVFPILLLRVRGPRSVERFRQ